MNVAELQTEALVQWDATPVDQYLDDDGVTHQTREARYRATFVEPLAQRINEAQCAGEINAEEARLLHEACLSAIPKRRMLLHRITASSYRLAEVRAQREMWHEHGVATRTRRQGGHKEKDISDLPWVGEVAGGYGVELDLPPELFLTEMNERGVIDDDYVDEEDWTEPFDPDEEAELELGVADIETDLL